MELSFSPDVDARVSYLIVLGTALWAAYYHVNSRLNEFPGAWTEWLTWRLYCIYVSIPLLLFWLLDRTGAINDTSLIAAVIVGVGFERILSGQGQTPVPSVAAGFWPSFISLADSISTRVSKSIAKRLSRFDRRLLEAISADETRFEALKGLSRSLSNDVQALDVKITEIRAKQDVFGPRLTREKEILALYAELSKNAEWLDLLRDHKVIDESIYDSYPSDKGVGSRITLIASIVVIAIALLFLGVWFPSLRTSSLDLEYHLWRLHKPNTTTADQCRTREALTDSIADHPTAKLISERICVLLRDPAMKASRVDIATQTLLAGAKRAKSIRTVAEEMIGALRVPTVDNRARVHAALVYLAQVELRSDPCKSDVTIPNFAKELCEWKPGDGDSIVDIELWIDRWSSFWKSPSPRTPPA